LGAKRAPCPGLHWCLCRSVTWIPRCLVGLVHLQHMPCRNLTVGTTCIGFSGGHSEPLSFPLFTQLTDEGAVHFHVNCYLFGTSGTLINAVMQWTPQCMSRSRPTNPCSSYTGSLNKPIPFFLVSSQLPHFLLLCCAFCLFPDFGFCWSCFCAG